VVLNTAGAQERRITINISAQFTAAALDAADCEVCPEATHQD